MEIQTMFDTDSFQSATVEGEISTQSIAVTPGEYQAVIEKIDVRETTSDKGTFHMLDVFWSIDDADVAALTGRDSSTVRQTIFLDLNASGGLDMSKGRNIGLGRLRKALGQDDSGPWSFNQLAGNVAMVKVENDLWKGATYANVTAAVAI